MPRDMGIIPGQSSIPEDYRFNEKIGIPDKVNKHLNDFMSQNSGKPLAFSNHAKERSEQRGVVNPMSIPSLQGKFPGPDSGFRPVEVEHNGNDLTKVVMRGPHGDGRDVVMPIRIDKKTPYATTAWVNENDDNHNTLDLNRVHLPEEFMEGKRPRRRLLTPEQTKMPGYQPRRHDSQKSKQNIIDKFVTPFNKPKVNNPAKVASAYNLPNCIDWERLRAAVHNLKRYGL